MTKKELDSMNKQLLYRGAWLDTYSPGDGVRRYRLLDLREWCERYGCSPSDIEAGVASPPDYFSGVAVMTVLGARAARDMVGAYIAGWEAGRRA